MKLLKLGERLAPADRKVPLWLGRKLAATPEGFDLGVSGLGPVAFTRLQAVAVSVTELRGSAALVILLVFEGLERPFVVEATQVAAATFGVAPQPLPEGNVRQVVTQIVRKLPGAVIDDSTYEFLKGKPPRDVGRRLADLAHPFLRVLKNMAPQAPPAPVPVAPPVPSPPIPPAAPRPSPPTPPAAPRPPAPSPPIPPAAPTPPTPPTASRPPTPPSPPAAPRPPAPPPAPRPPTPPAAAPTPPGPPPAASGPDARFVSRESPCWYDDRRGSLVYLTANELHSTRVRSRPKAEDILRYGQDPRVMKGVKTKVVPFRRIVRVIADSGLGRAEVRYSRGEAAKGDEKSKELRIPFHSKASGDSLLGRLGDRLGPSWTRLTSRRGKGRVAVLMWKPLLATAVPWLVLIYLFRHVLASGCAMVVLAAVGVPVVVVLVRGVMRVVKAPTEVEELVPAAGGGAQ